MILWKYRQWNSFTKAMLAEGEMYFATADQINDPFEFRWRERWPQKADEQDKFVREICALEYPNDTIPQRKQRYEYLKKEAAKLASEARASGGHRFTSTEIRLGVLCVSEKWDHPVMWSHYGDRHYGVCIGLETDAFAPIVFKPVEYSDELPTIDVRDYAKPDKGTFSRLALRKAKAWSYEHEWRTIAKPGIHRFKDAVVRILLGARCKRKTRSEIEKTVAKFKVRATIEEIRLSESEYRLVIDE